MSDPAAPAPQGEAPLWARPSFFVVALLIYVAIHFVIRMTMWHTLGIDDAEQALTAQKFAWSYRQSSPPLFAWLLLALSKLIGVNVVSISIVRYVAMVATLGFTYAAARRLIDDPRLSALGAYSFAAIYIIGYYSHRDLTHSAVMCTMLAASLYIFVRLVQSPTLGWYVALGVACGFGLLGKWNFVMFAGALTLACLILPAYRRFVLTWKAVAALAACALVIAPTVAVALIEAPRDQSSATGILIHPGAGYAARVMEGLWRLFISALAYPQPALALMLLVFAMPLWRGLHRARPATGNISRPDSTLLGLTIAIALALHLALVLALGAQHFYARLMLPPLFIFPIVVFMVAERGRPSRRAINVYAILMASLVFDLSAARVVIYELGADHCNRCRNMAPFATLADDLRALGYDGAGTIVTLGPHVGGNMRVAFPKARVIDPAFPPSVWPGPQGNAGCLFLWHVSDERPEEAGRDYLNTYLTGTLGGDPNAPHRDGIVAAPMFHSATKQYKLAYALYDAPTGDCR